MAETKPIERLPVNNNYHDTYTCEDGAHCVGELRHELLVNPVDEQLPDSAPVTFTLMYGAHELKLSIVYAGVSHEEAELTFAPYTDNSVKTLQTIEDLNSSKPGIYISDDGNMWVRTAEQSWVNCNDGRVIHDRALDDYFSNAEHLVNLKLTPWAPNS